MRKIIALASVLSVLAAGGAMAQDFRTSSHNAFPVNRTQQPAASVDSGVVTSGIGSAGFSAAQGFGPSDENSQPVPRFQTQNGYGEQGIVTSSTGTQRTYNGYNAADSFGASY